MLGQAALIVSDQAKPARVDQVKTGPRYHGEHQFAAVRRTTPAHGADAAVAFGGVSAKTFVFKSPTQLEVVTPPGASGAAVPVVVSVGSRSSSSTTGPLFTYQ
jgi:uncharacterized protein (TIGR03437 family)